MKKCNSCGRLPRKYRSSIEIDKEKLKRGIRIVLLVLLGVTLAFTIPLSIEMADSEHASKIRKTSLKFTSEKREQRVICEMYEGVDAKLNCQRDYDLPANLTELEFENWLDVNGRNYVNGIVSPRDTYRFINLFLLAVVYFFAALFIWWGEVE